METITLQTKLPTRLLAQKVYFRGPETVFGGNEVISSAILDRLLHCSHVFQTAGPNYRLKDKCNATIDRRTE